MNLLITGGAGFIGSNLIHHVIDQPIIERLVNLDCLTYAGHLENLERVSRHPKYVFEKVDLRDKAAVHQVVRNHRITHVTHLAAESHVDRSIDGPGDFIQTNIVGTFNLLEACRAEWLASGRTPSPPRLPFSASDGEKVAAGRMRCPGRVGRGIEGEVSNADSQLSTLNSQPSPSFRFHHVSTDEVYGSLGSTGAFTESTPYAPNSPYSASKASSDMLVRAYHHTYGLPTVITNCSNNYGPYQFPEKLIPVVIQSVLARKPIPVYGNGMNVRDWLYVRDHAEALWQVLTSGRDGETYNIGGNSECPNLHIVRLICDLVDELAPGCSNSQSLITFVKDRPGHDLRYAIDATKISKELGWKPAHSFEDGLRETVKWYLENQDWVRAVTGKKTS